MESKMFEKMDSLEQSGRPLWELPLPRVAQNRLPASVSLSHPDNLNDKWTCQRRIYAYSGCIRYFKRIDLVYTLLEGLCMDHHPRWAQEGAGLLPAGELPEIELAVVDIGVRALADNWSCQDTIRDMDQLRYFRAELPGYIFLTKLLLAVDEVAATLRTCLSMIKKNMDRIRKRLGCRYREHRRCYENPEPSRYRGLASGKESPLRNAVEFDYDAENAQPMEPPSGKELVVTARNGIAECGLWDGESAMGEWGSPESWDIPVPDDPLGSWSSWDSAWE